MDTTEDGKADPPYDRRHIYFDATLALDGPDRESLPSIVPGQAWAERARKEILGEMHAPTVQNLMVGFRQALISCYSFNLTRLAGRCPSLRVWPSGGPARSGLYFAGFSASSH